MREEVYEILPFILTLSNETFEYQKLPKLSALPGRGTTDLGDLLQTSSSTILLKHGEIVSRLVLYIIDSEVQPRLCRSPRTRCVFSCQLSAI